ncbi:MAG: DUF1971 domain-containing protein [Myxococcota bacterium]
MTTSPPRLEAYKQTPVFDETSIPAGLLRHHTTKAGVWARIHVVEGELVLRILEPPSREIRLTPQRGGEIAPQVPHEIEARGPVRFYVEFLRAVEAEPARS